MSFKLILILFVGFVLRLISLDQSLWLDEATSVVAARDFSFSEILTKFSPGDFHPPLYYLMLKVWISVFGSGEVAIRLMSVTFGVATIWLVYKITKIIFNFQFAIFNYFPALLFATAPLHIYYSQEARMYAPATFFASVVVYFAALILQSKKLNFGHYFGLIVGSGLLLYTDYLPVFLLFSVFVVLVLHKKDYLKNHLVWLVSTAIIFSPWIPTFLAQLQSGLVVRQNAPLWWITLGKTSLKELALIPVKFMIGRISSFDKFFYGISVAVVAVPFIFSLTNSLRQFSKTRSLWLLLILPITLTALLGFVFSGFSYFRLIFVLPMFYLLVAYGVLSYSGQFRKAVVWGVLAVNVIASSIYLFNPRFHREDWRGAVSYIEKNSQGDAAVVFVSKNQRDPYHYYAMSVPSFGPEGVNFGFPKVWLMRYVQPIFDPKDEVSRKLEEVGYMKVDERDFNGVVVWEYLR